MADNEGPGALNWRLSAHPITLLTYLSFRIGSLLMYLFGVLFIRNFVLVFILTLLLLSLDFYYLKNIAGRRLVGLRWWNEVNTSTGDSHWVFESRDTNVSVSTSGMSGSGGGERQNMTDKRFFWLGMYVVPALWVGLAVLAIVRLQKVIWLVTVGMYLLLSAVGRQVADGVCSHRPYPYVNEHNRLLEMRQVQPGFELRWIGVQHIQLREGCCRKYGRQIVSIDSNI
jgi:hypothetical protein